MSHESSTYNILSFDGGGIRGLMEAMLLVELDRHVPDWRDAVDLLAGTSTGGLLALGLAAGYEPKRLARFYMEDGPDIFGRKWKGVPGLIHDLFRARYTSLELERSIDRLFGDRRLRDLKSHVVISAFDLASDRGNGDVEWRPKFFHNFNGPDSDGDELCRCVARFATAAPTYFRMSGGFIDGGVVVNNPSMAAVAQALDNRSVGHQTPGLKDIRLLSIGSGHAASFIRRENRSWGLVQWARPLLDIFFDGQVGIPDYQCRRLLNSNYHRVEFHIPATTPIGLDAADRIPEMLQIVNGMGHQISDTVTWLKKTWGCSASEVS